MMKPAVKYVELETEQHGYVFVDPFRVESVFPHPEAPRSMALVTLGTGTVLSVEEAPDVLANRLEAEGVVGV